LTLYSRSGRGEHATDDDGTARGGVLRQDNVGAGRWRENGWGSIEDERPTKINSERRLGAINVSCEDFGLERLRIHEETPREQEEKIKQGDSRGREVPEKKGVRVRCDVRGGLSPLLTTKGCRSGPKRVGGHRKRVTGMKKNNRTR